MPEFGYPEPTNSGYTPSISGNTTTGGTLSDIASLFAPTNTGSRTYYNGLPLIMRNSKYATVHNKANRTIRAMPRQKFLFYATFNPGAALIAQGVKDFSSWQTGFAFQINKIDRPKFTIDVKNLNQYNRKRLVHTGIEYDPLTINFHDTVDDRVLRVWQGYYKWYFADGRPKSNTEWSRSILDTPLPFTNGYGFSPPNDPTVFKSMGNNTNFFESLDIYTFYGKMFTKHRVWNPKITSIEFDSMDTESSAFSAANMTIKYEGVTYEAIAKPITSKEITLFNLDAGDYYEPADLFGGFNSVLMGISDDIQEAVDGLLNNVSRNVPFIGQALAGVGSKLITASGIASFPTRIAQKLSTNSLLSKWGKF